ncbi:MAG: hypothetical protein ABW020_17090 [Candidatus Rokuibacteriota bacterium]
MDRERVRRWIAGFEAVEAADREERRRHGPDPAWSIRIALSMIEAARSAPGGAPVDPTRAADDARVRATWARLRARLG